jgi:hypothetical protein
VPGFFISPFRVRDEECSQPPLRNTFAHLRNTFAHLRNTFAPGKIAFLKRKLFPVFLITVL